MIFPTSNVSNHPVHWIQNYRKSVQFAHHQLFDPRFPPGGTLPLTGCWTDDEEGGRLIQGKSWTRVEIQGKELGSFPLTTQGRSVGHIVVVGFGDFSKERSLTHLNDIEDNELFSSD